MARGQFGLAWGPVALWVEWTTAAELPPQVVPRLQRLNRTQGRSAINAVWSIGHFLHEEMSNASL